MKKSLLTFAVLSMAAIAAHAQIYPTDKDGNITREDYSRVWEDRFDGLDGCGDVDGKLKSSEWDIPTFSDFDQNKDDFVDKEEWMGYRLADFDRIDVNHDGIWEPSELNKGSSAGASK